MKSLVSLICGSLFVSFFAHGAYSPGGLIPLYCSTNIQGNVSIRNVCISHKEGVPFDLKTQEGLFITIFESTGRAGRGSVQHVFKVVESEASGVTAPPGRVIRDLTVEIVESVMAGQRVPSPVQGRLNWIFEFSPVHGPEYFLLTGSISGSEFAVSDFQEVAHTMSSGPTLSGGPSYSNELK